MRMLKNSALLVLGALLTGCGDTGPLQVSGIYPHLAVYNQYGECGIGAVVPWAGKLWTITYPPHLTTGSTDKLYEIDPVTMQMTARPESVGGTHANRMIHRESNQLIIGPYFIDAQGNVRAADVKKQLTGRMTATARHLTDPANKVLFYDMEGAVYEVDVHSLVVKRLYTKPVPGWHGKGAYSGQGVFVVANNGESPAGKENKSWELPLSQWSKGPEDAGVLAEWDGKQWKVILRRQFLDVTGPGGIHGQVENDPDAPIWSFGWDKRSVILAVRDAKKNPQQPWSFYRLPKASHAFDPKHGWFTEWPRIRETTPGQYMMVAHGMMLDFPRGFAPNRTGGIRPIASHLRYIPDFAYAYGRLVLASDDTSIMQNEMAGISQSNLWFGQPQQLKQFGPAAGFGGVWLGDQVKAGEPSWPFMLAGFEKRVLHLSHQTEAEVKFSIEIDPDGDGQWKPYQTIAVPAKGYRYHIIPPGVIGEWIRIKADRDCLASAYVHYLTPSKHNGSDRSKLFASLAEAGTDRRWTGGTLRPARDKQLYYAAAASDAPEQTAPIMYRAGADLVLQKCDDASAAAAEMEAVKVKKDFEVDEASVIVTISGGKRFRLPRGPEALGKVDRSRMRGVREIQSERFMANFDGTFYEIPRLGEKAVPDYSKIKPVCSHNLAIGDFCTWQGLLVLSGTLAGAKANGHYFAAKEGEVGLWFGAVDDLWKLGKPVGRGGPWKNTVVSADQPSDPYLMTNYDRKRLEISHDRPGPVNFTVEVDPTNTGTWRVYQTIAVPGGRSLSHHFPDGYGAYWVRVRADQSCKATATFIYE